MSVPPGGDSTVVIDRFLNEMLKRIFLGGFLEDPDKPETAIPGLPEALKAPSAAPISSTVASQIPTGLEIPVDISGLSLVDKAQLMGWTTKRTGDWSNFVTSCVENGDNLTLTLDVTKFIAYLLNPKAKGVQQAKFLNAIFESLDNLSPLNLSYLVLASGVYSSENRKMFEALAIFAINSAQFKAAEASAPAYALNPEGTLDRATIAFAPLLDAFGYPAAPQEEEKARFSLFRGRSIKTGLSVKALADIGPDSPYMTAKNSLDRSIATLLIREPDLILALLTNKDFCSRSVQEAIDSRSSQGAPISDAAIQVLKEMIGTLDKLEQIVDDLRDKPTIPADFNSKLVALQERRIIIPQQHAGRRHGRVSIAARVAPPSRQEEPENEASIALYQDTGVTVLNALLKEVFSDPPYISGDSVKSHFSHHMTKEDVQDITELIHFARDVAENGESVKVESAVPGEEAKIFTFPGRDANQDEIRAFFKTVLDIVKPPRVVQQPQPHQPIRRRSVAVTLPPHLSSKA